MTGNWVKHRQASNSRKKYDELVINKNAKVFEINSTARKADNSSENNSNKNVNINVTDGISPAMHETIV